MSTENKNGQQPAFPMLDMNYSEANGHLLELRYEGLTKREYFAAMAMQGYCANESVAKVGITPQEKALASVQIADELLKLLNPTP